MVNIPLLNTINLPLNLANVFSEFLSVATFDILPSEKLTDAIFRRESFSEKVLDPLNERFELNSYTSSNFIYNMGSSFYFVVFVLVISLILLISTIVNNHNFKNTLVKATLERLCKIITPSLFIRSFLEINSNTLLSCIIQLLLIKSTKTWADYLSTILCIIASILLLTVPFFFAAMILKLKKAKILHLKVS
jgi:hypothetical protein